jgi:hypothetical protein
VREVQVNHAAERRRRCWRAQTGAEAELVSLPMTMRATHTIKGNETGWLVRSKACHCAQIVVGCGHGDLSAALSGYRPDLTLTAGW